MGAQRPNPSFTIDVAADGFRPKSTIIPVTILEKSWYREYRDHYQFLRRQNFVTTNKVPNRHWKRARAYIGALRFFKYLKYTVRSARND
jgi:hypothetical protein